MKPDEATDATNFDKPVAYDKDGRPLYAHPSAKPYRKPVRFMVADQAIRMARFITGNKPTPLESDSTKSRHDRSKRIFPNLNLSEDEYVIASIRRHPIGLAKTVGIGVIFIAFAFSLLFNYDLVVESLNLTGSAADSSVIVLPIILFISVIFLFMYIAYYSYINNRLFLTNESVIQIVQSGLFTRLEQRISLGSIEGASCTQYGILQSMVDYGTIRTSTVGDENVFLLTYVSRPKERIDIINNAVESFKNGRPVT